MSRRGAEFAVALVLAATPAPAAPHHQARPAAEAPTMLFLAPEEIVRLCGRPKPGEVRLGCRKSTADGPVLAVPDPCLLAEAEMYAAILCRALQSAEAGQ